MTVINCPNCKEPTFSWWQKQLLGTSKSIECSSCRANVSIDPKRRLYATIGVMVLVIVVTLCWHKYGPGIAVGVVLVALPLAASYQHYFIPLVVQSSGVHE